MMATGHLMRCISIAEMCRKNNTECVFIMAKETETERLRKLGFLYHILDSDLSNMEEELSDFLEYIQYKKFDWIVVDSYLATSQYLSAINNIVPVMYIDDMAEQFFPVTAILHYGIEMDNYHYCEEYESKAIKTLIGALFIPLREEFMNIAIPEKRNKSILITTGGTDLYNIAGRLVERIMNSTSLQKTFYGYDFHIIVGALNQHNDMLNELAMQYPQVHLHHNITNMSEYMTSCSLAVSAGGTTLYELCACGIPTVCFSFADNQKPGVQAMNDMKIMKYAGDAREDDVVGGCIKHLRGYILNEFEKMQYSKRMQSLVDGNGAKRIADYLCDIKINKTN